VPDDRLPRVDVQLVRRAVQPLVFRWNRRIEDVADVDADLTDDRARCLEFRPGGNAGRPVMEDLPRRMRRRCRKDGQQQERECAAA